MNDAITTDAGTPLPTGTVTFLFTDVQGSTELFQQFPSAYRDAVRRHHELLHEAVAAHGGVVFETVGDAVYGAFSLPAAAVDAAVAGQRALAAEPWGETGSIRVRMGIHRGEVERQGRHYFGLPLYRCARIMAAAHGGQIVVSGDAARGVEDALDPAVQLVELGAHRLKDLHEPERIVQVVAPGLERDFPPLRSLDSRPHNLPAQATALIGREREVGEARALLLREDVRLLTLTGPGGTGKTRLALEVVAEALEAFLDGAFFVPLAPISDPELVVPTIARTLGVQELQGQTILSSLTRYLRDKHLLLLLDNFEQVVEAASDLAALLAHCPKLKILVTSRVVLHAYGEQEYVVPPLELPDTRTDAPVEDLARYGAVQLFVERARAGRPGFTLDAASAAAVAEICRRLDGLPLAIELAAARAKLLAPAALLRRMEDKLDLLTGGAHTLPERQRTLRGAIAWSYDLLDAGEKAIFRRMGIFMGGASLEEAAAVCAGNGAQEMGVLDALAGLVDKSLVQQVVDASGEPRFTMLETIREFALEELELRGEASEVADAHAAAYARLTEEAESRLASPRRRAWFERVALEQDNLRAAMRHLLESGRAADAALMVGRLWVWWFREAPAEGLRWVETTLPAVDDSHPVAKGWAELAAASVAWGHGRIPEVRVHALAAEEIARRIGDTRLLALALTWASMTGAADPETAKLWAEEARALHRAAGDVWGECLVGLYAGFMFALGQRMEEAMAWLGATVSLCRSVGETWIMGGALMVLGALDSAAGNFPLAARQLEEALASLRAEGDRFNTAIALLMLGGIDRREGRLEQALAKLLESVGLSREIGSPGTEAACLVALAGVTLDAGDPERAARLLGAGLALRSRSGGVPFPMSDVLNTGIEEAIHAALAAPAIERALAEGAALLEDEQAILALVASESIQTVRA